ncbi:hypothetical protein GCM10023405_16820 [Streptomonospora salina]
MAAPRKYSDELRERATRMALDAIAAEGQRTGPIRRSAQQLDIRRAFRASGARPQNEVASSDRRREVPVAVVIDYIDTYRDRVVECKKLGVEPIWQV